MRHEQRYLRYVTVVGARRHCSRLLELNLLVGQMPKICGSKPTKKFVGLWETPILGPDRGIYQQKKRRLAQVKGSEKSKICGRFVDFQSNESNITSSRSLLRS